MKKNIVCCKERFLIAVWKKGNLNYPGSVKG